MGKQKNKQLERRLLSMYNKLMLVMEFIKVNFTKDDIEFFIDVLEKEKENFDAIGFALFSPDKYRKDSRIYELIIKLAKGVKQIIEVKFDDIFENGGSTNKENK